MDEEESRTEAAELIRNLIDRIVLTPSQDSERVIVDLKGDRLLQASKKPI